VPEAKAVAAVIAVHVDFGKLCLNLAGTPRPRGKKIAVLGRSTRWCNQIRKPQSLNVVGSPGRGALTIRGTSSQHVKADK
jgi:hypothetical protein